MSEPKEETPVQPQMSRAEALNGSLQAVKEIKDLLRNGHFSGNRANKIVVCLGYLNVLQEQIQSQIKLEK